MKGIRKCLASEVKCLASPPTAVKDTLMATALLLGHFEEETKRYDNMKRLLAQAGEKSITKRTENLDVNAVPLDVALGARFLMKDYTVDKIRNANYATAEFFKWNTEVIEAVLSRYGEEEISKTKPRTKQYVEEEIQQQDPAGM